MSNITVDGIALVYIEQLKEDILSGKICVKQIEETRSVDRCGVVNSKSTGKIITIEVIDR